MDKKIIYLYALLKLILNNEKPKTKIRTFLEVFNFCYDVELNPEYKNIYNELSENI